MSRDKLRTVTVQALTLVLLTQIAFIAAWGGILSTHEEKNIGVQLLLLMYDFNSPAELARDQEMLQSYVTPELYESLCIDNQLRMVNAYYKFGYAASHVQLVSVQDGAIIYRLVNDFINPEQLWVLLYKNNEDGVVSWVKEYSMSARREA